ncbi:MAG: hypothetical protein COA44_12600 [Arcobacter sp.]|nr:MAG: hypothetical protein COA44_12600 [Arcobacter sp.]
MKFIKICLVLLILGSTLNAKIDNDEEVSINFKDLSINEFVDLMSKILKKNILLTQPLAGKVEFYSAAPVKKSDITNIFISILESKGFTLVENGEFLQVVRSAEASKYNLKVVSTWGKIGDTQTMITQAIQVKGENVDQVAAKIRHLISKSAKLVTLKESGVMLLSDYPRNVETVKKVVREIQRQRKFEVVIVPIKNAKITTVYQEITEISKTIFNQTVPSEVVKVMQNTDLNSLVLVGKASNIKKLENYIHRLDSADQASSEGVEIIALKNSDAANVMKTIDQIIAKKNYPDPALKPDVSLNEEINSIILIGPAVSIKSLVRVIEVLDREKYQVYVKVRIMDFSNKDTEALGVKYGLDGGVANSSGLYTLAANFGGASIAPVAKPIADGLQASLGDISEGLAIGATLDFLQTNGVSKTISEPSILCVNNIESSIYVGSTLSFQTGSLTNASSDSTAAVSSSFQREDVGLTLKIKPRISSSDKVTLEVSAVLENVLANLDTNGQPITTKQEVTTQIILSHGETIVIGGLSKDQSGTTITKVPLLGDIPLIGALFTHTEETVDNQSMAIIITPYIVTSSASLSKLQKSLGILGKIQEQYNAEIFAKIENAAADRLDVRDKDDEDYKALVQDEGNPDYKESVEKQRVEALIEEPVSVVKKEVKEEFEVVNETEAQ